MAVTDIRDEILPEVRVLMREQRVRVRRLPATIDAMFVLLETDADVQGLTPEPGGFIRYLGEVGEAGDGPIQACLPVASGGHVMPNVRALVIEGDGPDATFPAVLGLYEQLATRMAEAGLTKDGPPRETYEAGRIRVEWPVRPA
jgi:hypothetical protein